MAQRETNVRIDFSGGMLILGTFVLIVLFWGEPDLHDAILHRLMGTPAARIDQSGSVGGLETEPR